MVVLQGSIEHLRQFTAVEYTFLRNNSHITFKNASSQLHTVFTAATATNPRHAAKFADVQTQRTVFTPWTAGYTHAVKDRLRDLKVHGMRVTMCVYRFVPVRVSLR